MAVIDRLTVGFCVVPTVDTELSSAAVPDVQLKLISETPTVTAPVFGQLNVYSLASSGFSRYQISTPASVSTTNPWPLSVIGSPLKVGAPPVLAVLPLTNRTATSKALPLAHVCATVCGAVATIAL